MRIKTAIAAATLLMLGSLGFAQQNVVGYNRIDVPATSDARLAVPFTTTPYDGSGAQNSSAVFTATGTSGGYRVEVAAGSLTSGKFNAADVTKASYYVRFLTGNAAGLWMTIKANDANGFGLDDVLLAQRAALLNKISSGDKFRVYKHVTINDLFPASLYGVSFVNGTTLLLYQNNISGMMQNPAAWKTVTYTTSNGGRWVGSAVDGTTILRPETQFVLRNGSASTLSIFTNGTAPDFPVSVLIAAGGDVVIGSGYPVPVVLNSAGLGGTSNRVVMFYTLGAGYNPSASKTATYTTSGGGRWVGSGVTGLELINPSQMIRLRLPSTETGTMVTIGKPY